MARLSSCFGCFPCFRSQPPVTTELGPVQESGKTNPLIANSVHNSLAVSRQSPASSSLESHQDAMSATRSPDLAEEHVLCTACHSAASNSDLLPTLKKGTENFRSYASLSELKLSSLSGCHLCSLLFGVLRGSDIGSGSVQVNLFVSRSGGAWLKVGILDPGETREKIMGELSVFRNLEGRLDNPPEPASPFMFPDPSIYRNARLSKSLSHDVSAALAREWLRQCVTSHKDCALAANLATPNHGYPTRLIQVTGDENLNLRLVLTENFSKSKPPYLTLSHCWGAAKILRLLLDNLADFQHQIPFNQLPPTFREAARVTRQLGHTHIWINSLCIIQDSKADWRDESKIMGDIYANSVCTISALTALSSVQGCFAEKSPDGKETTPRNPLAFRICHLPHGLHVDCHQRLDTILQIDRSPLPLHARGFCRSGFWDPGRCTTAPGVWLGSV